MKCYFELMIGSFNNDDIQRERNDKMLKVQ